MTTRRLLGYTLFLTTSAFVSPIVVAPCIAADRAAVIEYEFVQRPAGIAEEFRARQSTSLRFLTIRAIDSFRVDAALAEPMSASPATTTLIVSVHGSGGSYDAGPPSFLTRDLPGQGYAVLSINTRQTGRRINTDSFLEVRRDIEAAVYTVRALGYRAIVLHGHSLGNIQVQYYAANNWDPDIKAVVLTGMFANLPWKSRHVLVQNEELFAQLNQSALEALRQGRESEVLPVRMPRTLDEAEPVTAKHFLTYRAEASSAADGTFWIPRIPRPILLVRDAGDSIIQPFEPYMLLSAAKGPGSLVPSIEFVLLPNGKAPNPGGHGFVDTQQLLVATIAVWLREQKL